MKIHEVEERVGITRKNIRFYEAQGLLMPRRNSENGYREYGEEDVVALERIKLLRKLGLPLEEIRKMQSGGQTVADGMRRHLVTLEREQQNLQRAMELCARLKGREERLEALDAAALLAEMERLEAGGTTFMDKQKEDTRRRRYVASLTVALLTTLLMGGLIWLMLWAFFTDPNDAPPLFLVAVLVALPAVVILGVVLAAAQRVREIEKGEIDDAKKY